MHEKTKSLDTSKWIFPFCFSIIILASYLVSYKLAFQTTRSDLHVHIGFAEAFFKGDYKTATPIFYYVWRIFNNFFAIEKGVAGAYTYTFFCALNVVSMYFIIKLFLKDKVGELQRCAIVLFMSFIGPLYVQGFSQRYYLGQWSFNVWHNPTNTAVEFAFIIGLFLFIYSFDMDPNKKINVFGLDLKQASFYNYIIGLSTFISTLIKPSFFQVFAPTIVIAYLIDLIRTRKSIIYYIKKGIVFLPSVAVILYQTFILFIGEDTIRKGLTINFLDVWRYYSPNVLISILITITFPIFVIILYRKSIFKDFKFIIAIIFYIISALEGAFLEETSGTYSANLMWGMCLGIGAIFLYSVFKFVDYCIENKNNNKKW